MDTNQRLLAPDLFDVDVAPTAWSPPSQLLTIDQTPSPDLVRSITHELRQSLSLVVGYAELLTRAQDEPTRVQLLDEIRTAAQRLASSLGRLDRAEVLEVVCLGPRPIDWVLDLRG